MGICVRLAPCAHHSLPSAGSSNPDRSLWVGPDPVHAHDVASQAGIGAVIRLLSAVLLRCPSASLDLPPTAFPSTSGRTLSDSSARLRLPSVASAAPRIGESTQAEALRSNSPTWFAGGRDPIAVKPSDPHTRHESSPLASLPLWTCLLLAAALLVYGLRGGQTVRAQEPPVSLSQP